ncbi:hypothetical protein H0H92_006331 [Tricholoma furcatifolium]|nr:hypothetical protein H0H92_006331 [Tricholoma furcatifolium]
MVVDRRASVSAAPPLSRTSSTQPSRASTLLPIQADHTTSEKPKSKTKKIRSKLKRRKILLEENGSYFGPFGLFLLLLGALAAYTATVCRTDFPRTSSLCQTLDIYRTHIIEPYIKPPIETFIHHAEPYAEPLKPYAASAAAFTRTRIVSPTSALLDSLALRYHVHVTPRLEQFWDGSIKPMYFDVIHPHLERYTRPIRIFYYSSIIPRIHQGLAYAHMVYLRVRPHAQHYVEKARKNAAAQYEKARPHLLGVYQSVHPHAVVLLNQAQMQALGLANKAGDIRREYVDPHVRKILDKVGENGASSTSSQASEPPSTETCAHGDGFTT